MCCTSPDCGSWAMCVTANCASACFLGADGGTGG
jgi:hypothetical protein